MKNILLIRHGQSEWNKLNLFTGFKNIELSSQGVEEANQAGQNFKELQLKFDLVFTSELKRAQDTAKIILENLSQWEELNDKGKIVKNMLYMSQFGFELSNFFYLFHKTRRNWKV